MTHNMILKRLINAAMCICMLFFMHASFASAPENPCCSSCTTPKCISQCHMTQNCPQSCFDQNGSCTASCTVTSCIQSCQKSLDACCKEAK